MSYAIHPYEVSVAAVKKCIGSRNKRLLKKLNRSFRTFFDELDEIDEDAVPMKKALTQMIMGEKLDENSGFKYGYALKFLCEHVGNMLTNEYWTAMRWEWIEQVDGALAALRIDEKVFRVDPHLTTRGPPIALPEINDFPSIGYLLEAEIAKAAVELGHVSDTDIDDEEISESVGEVRKWLDRCSRSHKDLVCFYH